jgi:hypothetical protein
MKPVKESRKSTYQPTREKGAFEVCNYRGTHLGEYSFNEEKTGKPKSDHNIYLL